MAFSSNSSGGGPMADINVTPLVDVMLVLLIIFMITAPLMSHKVKVDLPQATLDQKVPQRQVDIRADNVTKYSVIAEVVKKARMAGIRKIGFVSTPERG